MKKLVLVLFVSLLTIGAIAQNIQTHYDMGKDRGYLTTTVEMFRPDKHGNTFFFIDINYGDAGVKGVSLAYWEIARAWNLGKSPFAAHLEYNGGFGQYMPGGSYQINDCYLGGIEYSWNKSDFSRGFTVQTLFKTIRGKNDASFQLTGVWYVNFLKGKMRFDGFADFWKEENVFLKTVNGLVTTEKTKFIFLSEPQIWYNFNSNFAGGSEIELSNNFGGHNGFMVNPTAALKYTF